MRNVNADRSGPPAVSTMNGMKCSSVAGSKYSRFSPDSAWWREGRSRPGCGCPRAPSSRTGSGTRRRPPSWRSAPARPGRARGSAGAIRRHAVARVPVPAPGQPLLEDVRRLVRPDEVLHLHLLELAHPEDEVAGADLVPEALADLGDPERQLLARALLDVLEVDVAALGRLRPEVHDRGVLLDRAHVRLEHQVEPARRPRAARRRPGISGRAARRCSGRAGPSRTGSPRRAARPAGSAGGRSGTRPAGR